MLLWTFLEDWGKRSLLIKIVFQLFDVTWRTVGRGVLYNFQDLQKLILIVNSYLFIQSTILNARWYWPTWGPSKKYLTGIWWAWEAEKLCEYAANAPDINIGIILLQKNNFRCSVPSSLDELCKPIPFWWNHASCIAILIIRVICLSGFSGKRSSHSKVTDPDHTVIFHQNILWFNVPMNYASCVEEV